MNWLHRLLHPHCEHCIDEEIRRDEARSCNTCATLIRQLEIANHEKEMLLERLLQKEVPIVTTPQQQQDLRPINNRKVPWYVEQRRLEEESRRKAATLRELHEKELQKPPLTSIPQAEPLTVEEIEKEIGIADGTH